jgi:hypothetical protein
MIPQAPSNPGQRTGREPLYDVDLQTGVSIEVFYADRALETFGRGGAGWFWWSRRRGLSPDGPATGPFATSYAAYRHAVNAAATSVLDNARRRAS